MKCYWIKISWICSSPVRDFIYMEKMPLVSRFSPTSHLSFERLIGFIARQHTHAIRNLDRLSECQNTIKICAVTVSQGHTIDSIYNGTAFASTLHMPARDARCCGRLWLAEREMAEEPIIKLPISSWCLRVLLLLRCFL